MKSQTYTNQIQVSFRPVVWMRHTAGSTGIDAFWRELTGERKKPSVNSFKSQETIGKRQTDRRGVGGGHIRKDIWFNSEIESSTTTTTNQKQGLGVWCMSVFWGYCFQCSFFLPQCFWRPMSAQKSPALLSGPFLFSPCGTVKLAFTSGNAG